ncbi:MAG: hypothetical protein R3B70_44475 [Polyangiaceae bacterium]
MPPTLARLARLRLRPSSLAPLLFSAFATLLSAGCCEAHENEVCAVMDHDVVECPSQEAFAERSGGDIQSGPVERYYIDMREDAGPFSNGLLCCYVVEYQSCDDISVY